MSISLDWLSAEFPTERAARLRINDAISHVWRVLRRNFGDAAVGSDAELLAVQADWFVAFAALSPEACRKALADAIALADCPSLAEFEALARQYLAVVVDAVSAVPEPPSMVSDGVNVSNESPAGKLDAVSAVPEPPSMVSDGVNVSNEIPAGKLDAADGWAWRLETKAAARHLIHFSQNGMAGVHRAAVEFHLTRSRKLMRKSDGSLGVNERAFVR